MTVNYESNYTHGYPSAPEQDAEDEGWGPNASWAETIATLVITAVALMFVTFLAVLMGLA